MSKPVVIVGAGVIGLSIGWQLSRAGCEVIVVDRNQAGRQTSWLSAGMLAPETELGFEDETLYEFGRESMRQWPKFVEVLEADSGMEVDYRTEGILHVASDRDEAEALHRQFVFQEEQGLDVQWLTGAEAREIEPFLAPRLPAAVFSRSDHQVDNQLLVQALIAAFRRNGGVLKENVAVSSIDASKAMPVVHLADGRRIDARHVILSAGPWSRQIEGIASEKRPPVRPVKGQMLQLRMDPRASSIGRNSRYAFGVSLNGMEGMQVVDQVILHPHRGNIANPAFPEFCIGIAAAFVRRMVRGPAKEKLDIGDADMPRCPPEQGGFNRIAIPCQRE